MNIQYKRILAALIILMASSLALYFATKPVAGQNVFPLVAAPARQQLNLDPGQSSAVNVRFYNRGESPVSGILRVADFVVDNNEGDPKLIEDLEQASPRFSAQSWFTLPLDQATIAANDQVTLQALVSVPADAHPGGRYVAIFFEPNPDVGNGEGSSTEAGTGIASRLAALVYVRINGDIKESALVGRFFVPGFLEYGPINVESQILNRGDYHIRPRGIVTVSNSFGGAVDQQLLKEMNIFPDMAKNYTTTLGKKWMIGKYKVSLSASYGEGGQLLERSVYMWVFPWRVALIVLLSLVILILIANNFYNRFIRKEATLEEELAREKEEISKLKEMLRKKD